MYTSTLIVDTLHKDRVESALRRNSLLVATDNYSSARTSVATFMTRVATRFRVIGLVFSAFGRISPPVPAATGERNADVTSHIASANSGD